MFRKKDLNASESRLLTNLSLEGFLSFEEGTVLIDGEYTGDIESEKGTLLIGEHAKVNGNINVPKLIVYGNWNGKCKSEYIELKKTCNIVSDNVRSKNLLIEEGAKFEGNFEIDSSNAFEI